MSCETRKIQPIIDKIHDDLRDEVVKISHNISEVLEREFANIFDSDENIYKEFAYDFDTKQVIIGKYTNTEFAYIGSMDSCNKEKIAEILKEENMDLVMPKDKKYIIDVCYENLYNEIHSEAIQNIQMAKIKQVQDEYVHESKTYFDNNIEKSLGDAYAMCYIEKIANNHDLVFKIYYHPLMKEIMTLQNGFSSSDYKYEWILVHTINTSIDHNFDKSILDDLKIHVGGDNKFNQGPLRDTVSKIVSENNLKDSCKARDQIEPAFDYLEECYM